MIPCRSSNQRWQTTGLDSAFGIRQADTPRRGPPRPQPLRTRRRLHRPEGPHGAVSAGVLRGQPSSARIPPVHFGFRTGSPRPLRGRGRRQDAGGRLPRRWNGWFPAGPPAAPTPGPCSERPPVPVSPHPLRLRRQGRRHRRRRDPRHPRRSEGMSVRGRTMDRGPWTGEQRPSARRCSSRERGD